MTTPSPVTDEMVRAALDAYVQHPAKDTSWDAMRSALAAALDGMVVQGWQPIESAPKDGTWFMICRDDEGPESCEIGKYDPFYMWSYVEVEGGLFRHQRNDSPTYEWCGFNNMHRATHWMPLAATPPAAQGK
jgi:hypothetical protein